MTVPSKERPLPGEIVSAFRFGFCQSHHFLEPLHSTHDHKLSLDILDCVNVELLEHRASVSRALSDDVSHLY